MRNRNFPGVILLICMLTAAGGALALRPTQHVADQAQPVDLAALVPHQFGNWVEEPSTGLEVVDPQQAAQLSRIYSQTLSRIYRNDEGYRVILSIAYGSDQRDSMQVHKPDVCYPAQGFVLKDVSRGNLALGDRQLPVTRVEAALGRRHEPITYWTTVGNEVVAVGVHKKLAEMRYGLSGNIPDGMLVRLSSIDDDPQRAYAMQQRFAADLLRSTTPEGQKRLFGTKTQGSGT